MLWTLARLPPFSSYTAAHREQPRSRQMFTSASGPFQHRQQQITAQAPFQRLKRYASNCSRSPADHITNTVAAGAVLPPSPQNHPTSTSHRAQ